MNLEFSIIVFVSHLFIVNVCGLQCLQRCVCSDENTAETEADCIGLNYIHAPAGKLSSHLKILYLQFNRISRLRSGEFSAFAGLKELYIHGNRIEHIDEDAFEGLQSLERLDLSKNSITTFLESQLLELSTQLKWLSLAMNAIRQLPSALSSMANLEHLDLSDNRFITMLKPESLPPNLISLDLRHTGVKYYTKSVFANLSNLKHLNLSDNMASSSLRFEEGVFDGLVSLEYLDLSRSFCKKLPRYSFAGLKKLQTLVMSNCWLSEPPILAQARKFDSSSDDSLTRSRRLTREKEDLSSIRSQRYTNANGSVWFNPVLTRLDLSNNRRMSLEPAQSQFPPSLLALNLGHTKITAVDRSMFQEAESMNELDLCHTKLTEVSDDAFQSFHNVTWICLSGNPLEVAPRLPASLEILDISETRLQNLTRRMLGNLHKVTEAYMNNGEIQSIEQYAFKNMTSLKKLDLSENQLTFLKRNSLRIPKPHTSCLLELNLSSNSLIGIQKGALKSHRQLQILDLSNNFIAVMERGMLDGLRNLQTLNLGMNTLLQIDGSPFTPLSNLKILRLEGNYIEYLYTNAFRGLNSLEELHLARNGLAFVESIALPSLVYLDIAENEMLSFPEIRSRSVRGIKAMFNPFKYLDSNTFSGTPNLQFLDISYCELANLTFSVFTKIKLQKLNLENNVLTDFVDVSLPSMEELYLAENKIQNFSVKMTEILPNITTLDLRHNNLKSLNPVVFESLSNLTIIDLSGNNFICDCDLVPLVKWMKSRDDVVIDADMYLCEGPPEAYALPIMDVIKDLECDVISASSFDVRMTIISCIVSFVVVLCLAAMIVTLLRRRRTHRTDENENKKNRARKDLENSVGDGEDSSILCTNCCCSRERGKESERHLEEIEVLMDEKKRKEVGMKGTSNAAV